MVSNVKEMYENTLKEMKKNIFKYLFIDVVTFTMNVLILSSLVFVYSYCKNIFVITIAITLGVLFYFANKVGNICCFLDISRGSLKFVNILKGYLLRYSKLIFINLVKFLISSICILLMCGVIYFGFTEGLLPKGIVALLTGIILFIYMYVKINTVFLDNIYIDNGKTKVGKLLNNTFLKIDGNRMEYVRLNIANIIFDVIMLILMIFNYTNSNVIICGIIVLLISDTLRKIKNILYYRGLNGEDIENKNRVKASAVNFVPNYNFDAREFTTVNTQTPMTNTGEYLIQLYDTQLKETKEYTKKGEITTDAEAVKLKGYLAKIDYLYNNPNEDLEIIHSKFSG